MAQKIIVICRTRNEAKNIDRFCQSYQWADAILIADGGSTDKTVQKALAYPNVQVKRFREQVCQNGYWRNPHGRHINFMIDWAKSKLADWIIFDDCDCVPTTALQEQARIILEAISENVVMLYRLYVWGNDQYFPEMNKPGQSLYAWRASVSVRASEDDPWQHTMEWPDCTELRLEQPLCCLHYYCPDEKTVERKLEFYRKSGEQKNAAHPLKVNGPLEELPEWAK